jgi:uncharacterized membrane protein YbhN (UPF0104 family)
MASAVALLACLLLAHVPGVAAGLTYLAPALFVFVLLWLGRYPGERVILARIVGRRLPRARSARTRYRRIEVGLPRGGRLLAAALAGRAPPLGRCLC